MRNSLLILVFLLTGLLSYSQEASQAHDLCSIQNEHFVGGEKLTYRMYYNWSFVWIPAGEVTFDVQENEASYEVKVVGKTYENYNSIFEVDDYFYSRFDRNTLLPQQFIRKIREGNFERYDSINFNQEGNLTEGIFGQTRKDAAPYQIGINSCTHDILSILYHTRNMNFQKMKVGEKKEMEVFFDKESYLVDLEFGGYEREKDIKNLGKYATVKLIPEMVAGEVFEKDSKMTIWVSDDGNRIPLLIESPVSIGSVKAVLLDHDGLKYPLIALP